MRRGTAIVLVAAALVVVVGAAAAQVPRPQRPPGPGGAPLPAGLQPPALHEAATDTARLAVSGPDDWPQPVTIALRPDTLRFGDVAILTLGFSAPLPGLAADSLRFGAPWAVPVADGRSAGGGRREGGDAGGVAAVSAEGFRVDMPLRLYRAGPLVAELSAVPAATPSLPAGAVGPSDSGPRSTVVMVAGRTTGLDEIAPIRPPRPLGWDAVMLLLAGLMAVALALLGWWLWRRRRSPELPADRDLGPPPEVAALQGLWELEGEAWTAFGAERRHLDRLSGVIRTYLGERYHLPAGELTAAEIVAAGARRGYAPDRLARYAALIGAGDRRRYRPGPVPRHECRAQMESAVALLAEERAAQSVAPVAPQVQRAADQAWEALRRRYTQAADPAGGPECDPGGAGTGDPGGVAP